MGIQFSSPQLRAAQSANGVNSFATSYAFAPTNSNAFGITARVTAPGMYPTLFVYMLFVTLC